MRDLWRGSFNLNHEVFIEYANASSERQAWFVMCRRIAKKTGVHSSVTMRHFDGNSDNFNVRKELEFEETK